MDRTFWVNHEVVRMTRGLDRANVLSLQALGAPGDIELHLLAFGQGAEAVRLDGRVVAEQVLAPAVLGDEAEALRIVEPLHGTGCHCLVLLSSRTGRVAVRPHRVSTLQDDTA